MIHLNNIGFSYRRKEIFKDFRLKIGAGETTLITGVNGVGKTTLLRLMTGVLLPQEGTVTFSDALGNDPRGQIAMITDKMNLYENMSLAQAIRFHSAVYGVDSFESPLLEAANLAPSQKIHTLSKGQKLIFHLALLLSTRPQVLLIDEVIHSMDVCLREMFLNSLLEMIEAHRLSLVMVNLNYHEIEKIIQRVILIQDSFISVDEPLDELKARVKRIDSTEKISDKNVIHTTRFGDRFEHVVYPYQPGWEGDREVTVQNLSLHEIIKAFMGEAYA